MGTRLFELLPRLIEALPHLDHFSSALDRFSSGIDRLLTSRATQEAALRASSEALRSDLARIDATTAANIAVLNRKLDHLSSQIASTAEAAQASHSITVALGHSIVAIERQLRTLRAFLITLIVLAVVLILMLGWILITQPRP
jgi:hypothetical protein